jgi:hypothetical protein
MGLRKCTRWYPPACCGCTAFVVWGLGATALLPCGHCGVVGCPYCPPVPGKRQLFCGGFASYTLTLCGLVLLASLSGGGSGNHPRYLPHGLRHKLLVYRRRVLVPHSLVKGVPKSLALQTRGLSMAMTSGFLACHCQWHGGGRNTHLCPVCTKLVCCCCCCWWYWCCC